MFSPINLKLLRKIDSNKKFETKRKGLNSKIFESKRKLLNSKNKNKDSKTSLISNDSNNSNCILKENFIIDSPISMLKYLRIN